MTSSHSQFQLAQDKIDGVRRHRALLGTLVSIKITGLPNDDAHQLINNGFGTIEKIHQLMSFHDAASDVTRLNREASLKPTRVNWRTVRVIKAALSISEASRGAFDISVGGDLVQRGALPEPENGSDTARTARWHDIEIIDETSVQFHNPLWIDLGGIAKGYAVDLAIEEIKRSGGDQVTVNAGGDIRVSGILSERILLNAPKTASQQSAVIDLNNGSIASSSSFPSSAIAVRATPPCHLDGAKRTQLRQRSFVSVMAEKCIAADALTKVVLCQGKRAASALRAFDAIAYRLTPRLGWHRIPED